MFLLHCLITSVLQSKASLSHFYPFTLSHPFLSMAITSSTLMPKMNRFSSPASSAISTLAPSMVPMVRAPLSMNFMFPVPEASVPAVEICSDRSAAGITEEQRVRHIQSHTQCIICNNASIAKIFIGLIIECYLEKTNLIRSDLFLAIHQQ